LPDYPDEEQSEELVIREEKLFSVLKQLKQFKMNKRFLKKKSIFKHE